MSMSAPDRLPSINTYAVLALLCGSLLLPLLGIYLGNQARQQIARTGERGTGLARAGCTLGWIITMTYGVLFVIECVAVISAFG